MTLDWHGRSMTPRTEVARRMRHADISVGQTGSLGLRAIGGDLPRWLAARSNACRCLFLGGKAVVSDITAMTDSGPQPDLGRSAFLGAHCRTVCQFRLA